MRFVDIRHHPEGIGISWQLLEERPAYANISNRGLPDPVAHCAFVDSYPYRNWFVIEGDVVREPRPHRHPVGTIYATTNNEIGVAILKCWQGQGYGARAIAEYIRLFPPLPAIPSVRNGHWLANIAPSNMPSRALFEGLGFELVQLTYQLPERGAANGEAKPPEG